MEENTLTWLTHTITYITLFYISFVIAKLFFKFKNRKIHLENELTIKDNVAFAVTATGYFIGTTIIFLGVLHGESHGLLQDSILILFYSILGNLLLILSSLINEKIVFGKKFKFYKEVIRDENLGTGFIEAANYIGSGLIIFGAISGRNINLFPEHGEIGHYVSDFLSLLFFWGLGQIIIYIFLKTYKRFLSYNFIKEIQKDNNAIGIVYASILISVAFLYSFASKGNIDSWEIALEDIAYHLGLAIILLPLSRIFIEKVILPKSNLTHEIVNQEIPNKGAALIEAFAYIGSSIIISFCM
ncbi:uncharacterized protein DUF350 [Tenacibaculum skagerrakense]|uniref:Uncharacterized protein DUF350 n=1 Tax=Tenacibaculum skagerrakense TaxID=186571 RepID=A0A4R2NS32_9FLAO|nr:DUF350 domain-containing protein [Tenacibaculum skagerrakense]TCP24743.1 uncharacterized protein DUF350 [Tenacibaculum skagerrakense]